MNTAKEILARDGMTEHNQCEGYVLKVQEIVEYMEEFLELKQLEVITPFWLWMVREAKIDVIDAENFIEVHGFKEPDDNLIPVISFKELFELYKSQNVL